MPYNIGTTSFYQIKFSTMITHILKTCACIIAFLFLLTGVSSAAQTKIRLVDSNGVVQQQEFEVYVYNTDSSYLNEEGSDGITVDLEPGQEVQVNAYYRNKSFEWIVPDSLAATVDFKVPAFYQGTPEGYTNNAKKLLGYINYKRNAAGLGKLEYSNLLGNYLSDNITIKTNKSREQFLCWDLGLTSDCLLNETRTAIWDNYYPNWPGGVEHWFYYTADYTFAKIWKNYGLLSDPSLNSIAVQMSKEEKGYRLSLIALNCLAACQSTGDIGDNKIAAKTPGQDLNIGNGGSSGDKKPPVTKKNPFLRPIKKIKKTRKALIFRAKITRKAYGRSFIRIGRTRVSGRRVNKTTFIYRVPRRKLNQAKRTRKVVFVFKGKKTWKNARKSLRFKRQFNKISK